MYNLTTKIDALARGFDPSKKSALIKVAQAARPVISLTEQAKRKKTKTNAGSTMGSIVEEDGPQESDYFADPEIRLHLEEMGYELEGVIFGVNAATGATHTFADIYILLA
ncbi:hypothetical protein BS17DRAFT_194547 [Gyrodon lividus]|nr:hypothetical protein BS17DRAFT_194547 [Gyrodon lividus]